MPQSSNQGTSGNVCRSSQLDHSCVKTSSRLARGAEKSRREGQVGQVGLLEDNKEGGDMQHMDLLPFQILQIL